MQKQHKITPTRALRPTMNDVAREAKVSLSTVSHVLNNTAPITQETRQRVTQAVQRLGYIPNTSARELRQKRTGLIGIIVPDISNEFYARCVSGLLSENGLLGRTAVICDSGYSVEQEQRQVTDLIQRRVEGLIFFGGLSDEVLSFAKKNNVPVVLGDRAADGYCCVEFDNHTSIHRLIALMKKHGIHKIGFVSEPVAMVNVRKRLDSFYSALRQNQLTVNEDWIIIYKDLQLEKVKSGEKIMDHYLKTHSKKELPQVFMASSDLIAIGIIESLKRHGYRVPEDIAVTGIDDIQLARYHHPSLTTIRQDSSKMGSICYNLLMNQIENPSSECYQQLECEIVIRDSLPL